jgi:hypothetical protein
VHAANAAPLTTAVFQVFASATRRPPHKTLLLLRDGERLYLRAG